MTINPSPLGWRRRTAQILLPAIAVTPLISWQSVQAPIEPARITVDLASTLTTSGVLHGGIESKSPPKNALQMLQTAGLTSGTYRRSTKMYENDAMLPFHVKDAQDAGLDVLLTVLATPQYLATPTNGTTFQVWNLPPYARTMPSDPQAWADLVVERIDNIYAKVGTVPDYIEIWNEIDRVEFWEGSLQDYETLYATTATTIRAAYPQIKIGGPGLAGHFSTLEGTESALAALSRFCATNSVPLDFLSWHHYTEANELSISGVVPNLRSLHQSLGLGYVELIISEWNIWANVNKDPWAFDSSVAAAQMAGFLTTALEEGLDRSTFFQLYDLPIYNASPLLDLQGAHLGAITTHGIKKPSARVLGIAMKMMADTVLVTERLPSEHAVRVMASRTGDRLRLLVSNDEVEPKWLWVQRCREYGFISGELFDRFVIAANQAGVQTPTAQQLAATGQLTLFEAQFCLDTAEECQPLIDQQGRTREVRIKITNLTAAERTNGRLQSINVFDSIHNNYAKNVAQIQVQLVEAEEYAQEAAYEDAAAYLTSNYGYTVTGRELELAGGIEPWLNANGGNGSQIFNASMVHREAVINRRMEGHEQWDNHAATRLQTISPQAAGVYWDEVTNEIVLTMEPNSVTVIEAAM